MTSQHLAKAATAAVGVTLLGVLSPGAIRSATLGLGSGCLVAAIALAIVLTYQGSGVVNFASGALAAGSAYWYDALRREGALVLPPLPNPLVLVEAIASLLGFSNVDLPEMPSQIDFGGEFGFLPAAAIATSMSALAGVVVHLAVFRPLRGAPPLARVVASVGVLLVIQAILELRFTSTPRAVQSVIDKSVVRFPGGVVVPRDQLVLSVIVVLAAVALWAVHRSTRFGLATRAAAENEKAATILGFSPDRLGAASWALSTALVGLFGVLMATVNGAVDPVTFPLLVVPALGAALLGRFRLFGVTVAAGFGIAMAQSVLQYFSAQAWFPHTDRGPIPGLREVLPVLVIAVTLLLRGHALPTRGLAEAIRLPAAPRPNRLALRAGPAVVLAGLALVFLGPDWRLGLTNSLIGMVACLSLVVMSGYVGQISLAQMAIAGIAGFTLSKLSAAWGVPFPLAPLLGAIAATAVGLIVAVPALRIRGVNLAVMTLAAAIAVENAVLGNPAWTGSADGAAVPPPSILGWSFGPNSGGSIDGKLPSSWFGLYCLVMTVAVSLGVVRLRRSSWGQRMLAVRSNERAAAAAGIDVARTKLFAFAVASFIAGVAGTLSAYRFGSVSPTAFGGTASLMILAFAYLGGLTTVTGAALGGALVTGGVIFTAADQWLGVPHEYTLLLGGLGLIANAVFNPEGIAGAFRLIASRLMRRVRENSRSLGTSPRAALAGREQ